MTTHASAPAGVASDGDSLPLIYQAAAATRRLMGAGAASALSRSPFAAPLRRVLRARAPSGVSLVEVCGGPLRGANMHVDLGCEKFYWLGTHEAPLQRIITERLRPGAVVYDAGAHAGFFTLLFSRLVGDTGRVIAFEPLAANAERLRANLAANDVSNADVRGIALSDRDGEVTFSLHASTLEGAISEAGTGIGTIAAPSSTIDRLVAEGMPAPNVIKIDVEGAEGAVLRGGRSTIAACRPDLFIEVHSDQAGREVTDALPIPYVFTRVGGRGAPAAALAPGHYLGVAAAT